MFDSDSAGPRRPHGSRPRRRLATATALGMGLAALGAATSASSAQSTSTASAAQIAVAPMTRVVENPRAGYFSDPYPIHSAPFVAAQLPQTFSGTTSDFLTCPGPIRPECFDPVPLTVDIDALRPAAKAFGSTIVSKESIHPYQDRTGEWQMVLSLHVSNPEKKKVGVWSVIVHAHPAYTSAIPPLSWVADSVLIGSLAEPGKANYDGKYFEDDGKLYLLYSKRLSNKPARDGVVAQLMDSPTALAPEPPTTLLAPDEANGGFNSEYFNGLNPKNPFKLIETGNPTLINGKYALLYSTGAFNQPGYKTGIAWSDTFLPKTGSFYRKVLQPDTADVWGQPNHLEVRYLLQSQEPAWPNYAAAEVLAPGVPSIRKNIGQDLQEDWFLYFAGYDPANAPTDPKTGYFQANFRRPYFVGLHVNVPASPTVAAATDAQLAGWVTPVTQ